MRDQPRAFPGAAGRWALFVALAASVALLLTATTASAHHRHWHGRGRATSGWSGSPTDPGKDAALVVDGATGKVLYSRNADAERHPASLTKMMTLYLLFDALKQGKVTMATQLAVSQHAAWQHPTNLHLSAGDQIPVDVAIRAIVIRSANDVAVAIAEALGGTEAHFAEMMTAKAREFGMRSTYYHNASGLPDPLQITTASDLAILARHLAYDFPQYFHYFSLPGFSYRGVNYPTHDNLIGRYDGADGIKTGYTGASGFNLVSSVVRGGAHVIGVVMGGRTAHLRDREMVRILDATFNQIGQSPTLVAHMQVPWQSVAQNNTAANTGFLINATPPAQGAPGSALAFASPQPNFPSAADDEEAAEAQTNEGNADLAPQSEVAPPPKPPVAAAAPSQQPPVRVAQLAPPPPPPAAIVVRAPVKPRAKPAEFRNAAPLPDTRAPAVVAAYRPQPKPAIRPEIGEGDISFERVGSTAAAMNVQGWVIQIGAFANQTLARSQLASYAERSMDVLGQAARTVVPFQSADGHTLYRARFGPFPEREAREVCSRLTQRGQTCFAAVATR